MLDLIAANTPLFLTGVFIFGLLIGSFLNVVILRLPARLEHDWRCQCKELLAIESLDDKLSEAPPGHYVVTLTMPQMRSPDKIL